MPTAATITPVMSPKVGTCCIGIMAFFITLARITGLEYALARVTGYSRSHVYLTILAAAPAVTGIVFKINTLSFAYGLPDPGTDRRDAPLILTRFAGITFFVAAAAMLGVPLNGNAARGIEPHIRRRILAVPVPGQAFGSTLTLPAVRTIVFIPITDPATRAAVTDIILEINARLLTINLSSRTGKGFYRLERIRFLHGRLIRRTDRCRNLRYLPDTHYRHLQAVGEPFEVFVNGLVVLVTGGYPRGVTGIFGVLLGCYPGTPACEEKKDNAD